MRRRPGARWLALCGIFVAVLARPASAAAPVLGLSERRVPPRGHITVTFELARPATIAFSITRLAPAREKVGAFAVRGRAGTNRFLFPGRLDRRLLRPGTYRLAAEIHGARALSPTFRIVAAAAQTGAREGPTLRMLVVLLLALAIPLLAVAALPERALPRTRWAELLAAGRSGLAYSGLAVLGAALALYIASLR